ncbi:NADH-quinone oxidoreductase subunit N [Aquirufa sp. HETE-83D]|uniref:NADH-quinone oxidoreductase subunit N n=1 Tax=Aquirufa esocilacus TaxID=3096513 RepID=A0ABW6DHF8_9BACT
MTAIIALSLLGILNLFLGFWLSRKTIQAATLLFLTGSMVLTALDWNHEILWYGHMFHTTNTSISFSLIIQLAAFMVVSFSKGFGIDEEHTHPAEYYAILLFSVVGAILMVSFDHLIMFFVGLEILSVAMYVLTGSDKRNLRSNEAALKYFLMGSFATGILLFGITLVYGATRSFYLANIAVAIANTPPESTPVFLSIGVLLILVGFLFKISAAPFHFWTPDVYEGAPTIFTMFMSTVVKAASFAALFQLLSGPFGTMYGTWVYPIYYISMLTLLVGNITAVYQQSVKRMLAYSSISHAGYMLLTVSANQTTTPSTILYYSLSYTLATIVAFGVVMLVAEYQTGRTEKPENFSSFEGLAKQNPGLAFCFTIAMLSLAGIPLTAGFWGKFFVFSDIFTRHVYYPVILAIIMSAIGVYYYFKGIIAIYFKEGDIERIELPGLVKFAMWACTLGTLLVGVYPSIVKNLF